MEACSQARFVAAKVHTVGYIFRAVRALGHCLSSTPSNTMLTRFAYAPSQFRSALDNMPPSPEKDVLVINCRLYGLHQIEEQAGAFLKCQSTSLAPAFSCPPRLTLLSSLDGQTVTSSPRRWTKLSVRFRSCVPSCALLPVRPRPFDSPFHLLSDLLARARSQSRSSTPLP